MKRIVTQLVQEMVRSGIRVAGYVSNGEFNYMRSKGYTRSLSVLQVRTNIRNKYNRIKQETLLNMLTLEALPDGTFRGRVFNPAVPAHVLTEIVGWMRSGVSVEDVVDRLRVRTVPSGYSPHPWTPGKEEGLKEKLRSILAQFEFEHSLKQWEAKGVNFRLYLYVPEVHPETREVFYEREDEAHVLKRIANHTRCGGPAKLRLERFVEALQDPSSGLTVLLTGSRKQSVIDAERLFNPGLAEFMRSKGYEFEAHYIEVIWNWRRACDHRGLSELQRCHYNYDFLNLILDELMPWHKDNYDFSCLEVNRPINNILGFSKETLVAVIANIEGREWRRWHISERGNKPEHPRASTSDDVECFFGVMRDAIGQNFTAKQVKFGFRKVCTEFSKRLDPKLPYFYHTSSHTRYSEGPLPDFSQQTTKKRRKSRKVPRREQPIAFTLRRATLPVHGSISVQTQYHNRPIDLPPPPTAQQHVYEHSYS